MLFRKDPSIDHWFFVDRQLDEYVVQFSPCADCQDKLNTLAETGETWFPGQLCGEDYTAFECLTDAGDLPCGHKDDYRTYLPVPPALFDPKVSFDTSGDSLDGPPEGYLRADSDLRQPETGEVWTQESQDRFDQEMRLALSALEEFNARQDRLRQEELNQDREQPWRRLIPGNGTG